MNWNDILTRLKDARTWAALVSIVNLILSAFGVAPEIVQIVNAVIALIAFILFGVEIAQGLLRQKAEKDCDCGPDCKCR